MGLRFYCVAVFIMYVRVHVGGRDMTMSYYHDAVAHHLIWKYLCIVIQFMGLTNFKHNVDRQGSRPIVVLCVQLKHL